MKLTKISNNFTPINEGIFFGIDTETDEPTDLTVEIVDARNGQIVATQLLRSVTYAEVNIAPYVEQFSAYQPSTHKFATIVEAPTASYYIRIGSELSESIILSVNQTAPTKSSIVSSMPKTRRISYGEGDELLLLVDAGDTLTVDITTDMGDGSSLEYITERGVASLFISTKEFSEETHSINVEIARNGELLGALCYHLIPSHKESVRLAWLSDLGSIERYTFPIVTKVERMTRKNTICTSNGREVVESSYARNASLISRYEPKPIIEALAHIISSTKVWIEEEGKFTGIEVLSSELTHNLFGEPCCVELSIATPERKGVMLW